MAGPVASSHLLIWGSQLTQFWPWEGGAVGSAGLADKSFWPFALCLSPSFFFLLETQTWCLEAQGPSCDNEDKSHVDGWRNRSRKCGPPCALGAYCNGHRLLPSKVPELEKNKSNPDYLNFYEAGFLLFAAIYIPKGHISETEWWCISTGKMETKLSWLGISHSLHQKNQEN